MSPCRRILSLLLAICLALSLSLSGGPSPAIASGAAAGAGEWQQPESGALLHSKGRPATVATCGAAGPVVAGLAIAATTVSTATAVNDLVEITTGVNPMKEGVIALGGNEGVYDGIRLGLDVATMLTPGGGGKTKAIEGTVGFVAGHADDAARVLAGNGDDAARLAAGHGDDAAKAVKGAGRAADDAAGAGTAGQRTAGRLQNGTPMTTDEALDTAIDLLGDGYREIAPGVFRSADGTLQFRMTDSDILGQHYSGPHVNFDVGKTITRPNGRESFSGKTIHVLLTD